MTKDFDLLTSVYKSLNMNGLLKEAGLQKEEVDSFFKKVRNLLVQEAEDAERHASLIMYIDGSARGNPGPAGAGVVTTDVGGDVLEELSFPLGKLTNNAAEYHSLIAAIGRAIEWKAKEVTFRSDSKLLVEQMHGGYRIKSRNLMSLCVEARSLLKKLPNWKIEHIPREQNKHADHLATIAAQQNG